MKETEPPNHPTVLLFDDDLGFINFLYENKIMHLGCGAVSFTKHDKTSVIAIPRYFYAHAAIPPEHMQAIILHEEVELISKNDDPHREATQAEYRYVLNTFGQSILHEYHTKVCNLIGDKNNTRKTTFQEILTSN
jgi:hypothetical protein